MLRLLELSIKSIKVKEELNKCENELNNYDTQVCKYLKNNNEGYIALEKLNYEYDVKHSNFKTSLDDIEKYVKSLKKTCI